MLNGTQVSVNDFPRLALNLYQTANLSAPNRAINILGMARSNSQLRYNGLAATFYQTLLNQMQSSNNSDPIFSQEATDFIAQQSGSTNSANNNQFCFSSIFIVFIVFIFH